MKDSERMNVSLARSSWRSPYRFILYLLIILEISFFSFYGISRHYNYMTSINDLGHMDQAIWGLLNGYPFLNTDVFNTATSRLGLHFDPVLALFTPLYLVFSNVIWLILAQAFLLPLTSLPIYFLALQVTKSEYAALFWAAAYLFSPFMLSAASWDFHPVTLASPFIALAYLAIEQKKYLVLLTSSFFILLCKEHFGLLVFGFGMLWFFRHRKFGGSASLALLGLGHMYLVFKFIMPFFSPSGQHLMLSTEIGQLSRYGWLGSSIEEIIIKIFMHPAETVRHALITMGGQDYLVLLLIPMLFLPIFGFEFLLPGAADFFANLLSANPMPRSIFAYHSATLIPVLIVAAIYGSRRISRLNSLFTITRQSFTAFAVTLLLGWVFFPFFSLPGGYHFWEPKRAFAFHDPDLARVKELVPPNMSLSVQANIGAHFTQRHEVHVYPAMLENVDAIILRLDSPTELIRGRNPGRIASLAHHLMMDPMDYLGSIRTLLKQKTYSAVVWHDPWLILTKDEKKSQNLDNIIKKIDALEIEWQLTPTNHSD